MPGKRWEIHLCPVHDWTTETEMGRCGVRLDDGTPCGRRFTGIEYTMPVGEAQDLLLEQRLKPIATTTLDSFMGRVRQDEERPC